MTTKAAPMHVWLIHCTYKCPNQARRGHFANQCFLTEKEAKAFCAYHSSEEMFMSWEKILVGAFTKPRRKKGVAK